MTVEGTPRKRPAGEDLELAALQLRQKEQQQQQQQEEPDEPLEALLQPGRTVLQAEHHESAGGNARSKARGGKSEAAIQQVQLALQELQRLVQRPISCRTFGTNKSSEDKLGEEVASGSSSLVADALLQVLADAVAASDLNRGILRRLQFTLSFVILADYSADLAFDRHARYRDGCSAVLPCQTPLRRSFQRLFMTPPCVVEDDGQAGLAVRICQTYLLGMVARMCTRSNEAGVRIEEDQSEGVDHRNNDVDAVICCNFFSPLCSDIISLVEHSAKLKQQNSNESKIANQGSQPTALQIEAIDCALTITSALAQGKYLFIPLIVLPP